MLQLHWRCIFPMCATFIVTSFLHRLSVRWTVEEFAPFVLILSTSWAICAGIFLMSTILMMNYRPGFLYLPPWLNCLPGLGLCRLVMLVVTPSSLEVATGGSIFAPCFYNGTFFIFRSTFVYVLILIMLAQLCFRFGDLLTG